MSESIEKYDHLNITYDIAKVFARIQTYAFKDDILMRLFWPQDLLFGDDRLPVLAEYEDLKRRVELFGKLVESAARRTYLETKSNPRKQLYLLKSADKYVAGTFWMFPEYLNLQKISLIQKVVNFFRKYYYSFLDYVSFFRTGNPDNNERLTQEFEWAGKHLGGKSTEDRVKELEAMSPKELDEAPYPKDLSYYLHLMAVRSDYHGKGLGKKLLIGSLEKLKNYAEPPPFGGPAKVALFSSPDAPGFYRKLGFSLGKEATHETPEGHTITHSYFFKNVE